jgi:pyruvate dehydrogenase E1 component
MSRSRSARRISIRSGGKQPAYPGNREIERRIKSLARWNAMAMVVNANHGDSGVGGHISSYASMATLYEVAYNHFFRGGDGGRLADLVYFQGHTTPGNYARAFLEYRLDEGHLHNFRTNWPKAADFPPIRIRI